MIWTLCKMMLVWIWVMILIVSVAGAITGTLEEEKDVVVTSVTHTTRITTGTTGTTGGKTMLRAELQDENESRTIPYVLHGGMKDHSNNNLLYNSHDHHYHRYIQETDALMEVVVDDDDDDDDGDTFDQPFFPSTTPSPSVSFVPSSITTFITSSSMIPSSIPSMSATETTTATTIPTSLPIGTLSPQSSPPPLPPPVSACHNDNRTITTPILPQVRYTLFNQDRITGEDLYSELYPDAQLTYRPCYFSIQAEIDMMIPSPLCPPDELPMTTTVNHTILSVRMVLYYYNQTTATTEASNTTTANVEIIQDQIERTPPYFLYGNSELRMIYTNPNLLPDGEYSIQSTIRFNITNAQHVNGNDDIEMVTFTVKQIVTPPLNFTLYPCVE